MEEICTSITLLLFGLSGSLANLTLPIIANSPIHAQPTQQIKLTLSGHTAPVRALALSPNSQVLASGSDDGTIKLWNPATGVLLRTLAGDSGTIKSIIFAPDGQTLISRSSNNIKFWNSQTGQEIREVTEKSGVNAILLTPNGQTLISASGDRKIKFSNLKTGKISQILQAETTALAISPDGKTLFSGGENGGRIRSWSINTGKQLRSFFAPANKEFSPKKASAPITLVVSHDGQMLLSGGYDDSFQSGPLIQTDGQGFKAWQIKTGKLVHNFSVGTNVDALVISPDNRTFIAGGLARQITLRDLTTGKPVMQLVGHAGGIYALVFSRDGKTLYSGSGDKSVKAWQIIP